MPSTIPLSFSAMLSAAAFSLPASATALFQFGNANNSSALSREISCSGSGKGFCSTVLAVSTGVGVASEVVGFVSAVLIGMSAVLGVAGLFSAGYLPPEQAASVANAPVNPAIFNILQRSTFLSSRPLSRFGLFTIKLQSPPSGLVAYDVYATHLAFVVIIIHLYGEIIKPTVLNYYRIANLRHHHRRRTNRQRIP